MKLKGKNAIITGANRGIGKATLEIFAKNGANIWACSRRENDEFSKFIESIKKIYNVNVYPVYFDLNNEEEIKQAAKKIVASKKKIDILVNNAGIAYNALFNMTSINNLKEVFQINFFSQVLLTQIISRIMIKQKSGSIINIASVGGIEANKGYLAYGSSKAAVIWETRCLAKELGIYNIRVNAIAPGLVNTDMGYIKSDEEIKKVINRTPLNRMADIDEITKAILFLASDDASYINGEILKIDGGRCC